MTRILTRNDVLGRTEEEFLRLGEQALIEEYKLKPSIALRWHAERAKLLTQAKADETRLEQFGVTLVTAADASYPRQIENFDPDAAAMLYLYGNRRLLSADTFCVLSSRNSPPEALTEIELRTEEHVLRGKILVTGHDTEAYQRSAVTSLRWGSPRIVVLDSGFFQVMGDELRNELFPAARLWRYEFDAQTDLAIAAVAPTGTYHRNSNRIRDRIVAGLSLTQDYIIVSPGGNMEKLARLAARAGRNASISELSPVFDPFIAMGLQPLPVSRRR